MSDEDQHLSRILEVVGFSSIVSIIVGAWSFIKRITVNTELIRELIEKTDAHDKKLDAIAEKVANITATCRFHHPDDRKP
jgi:hypothetical protein